MANEQILVVEDEGIVALDIQSMLEDLGYQVPITVASGEEAIEEAAKSRPDLALMDINLEGEIDGIGAAEQLRDRFNIPVVYLTAYSDENTLQRAKLTTPFGYLVKPLEARSLKTTIEMAIYRHQLEQQLKQSKEWFATTLRSIGDAVIATDEGGRISFINSVAESLTGWSQAEALGKDVSEVFRIANEITEALADRVLIMKNGTKIPIDDTVAPISSENEKIIGAVYVFRDISAKKQTEALEKERIRLETEVKERSLAEAEIRRSLEIEKELSDLKSRLITTISHEFRTPMSVILSSTELLQAYSNEWSEEKKNTHYQRIKSAIEYMTGLVKDIMLVGEAETGKLEFNPSPLNLVEFCSHLIEEIHGTASEQHQISFVRPTQAIDAAIDPQLLRQILINLLSNAIKYSPDGGEIKLELAYETFTNDTGFSSEDLAEPDPEKTPDRYAIFRIQDRGIGIPHKDQQQLFESFQRATNVGTIRGTGLGLTIVKKCVELHKGQIEVESEVGIGTTFTVKIPISASKSVTI